MSIETRIQAINDHLIDDYKVLRLAGADLTGVNKNIINLKMSWKERLLYFMNNGTDEMWDNWDKVSGTGTTLSLNNTEEAPMSLTYKGNTSQNGTPTPTSPIPVQVVSGDNSIEVCGLNIAQKKLGLGTYGGSETTTVITDYANREYSLVEIKPSTQYTILRQNTNSTNFRYFFYDTKPIKNTTLSIGGGYINDTSASKTFTTPSNAKWLFVQWSADGTNYSAGDIQIALGTSTTYQPYQSASYPISLGDKELCKIGTYQDKIFKNTPNTTDYDSNLEDNVWYLKKEIGKVVLNGSEMWGTVGSVTNGFYTDSITTALNPVSGTTNIYTYCDKLISANRGTIANYDYSIGQVNNGSSTGHGNIMIKIKDVTGTPTTWLSTNNLTVYYVLATPTYEEITDTTLLSQLEALKKSYEEQTNISQVNNDLPFELDVVALEVMS